MAFPIAMTGFCSKGKMALTVVRDTTVTLACVLYIKNVITEKYGKKDGLGSSGGR